MGEPTGDPSAEPSSAPPSGGGESTREPSVAELREAFTAKHEPLAGLSVVASVVGLLEERGYSRDAVHRAMLAAARAGAIELHPSPVTTRAMTPEEMNASPPGPMPGWRLAWGRCL